MFPPNIIKNATVLDLGACLGAACHYALCCGASKVVGVEVQEQFCERALSMLDRAAFEKAAQKVVVAHDASFGSNIDSNTASACDTCKKPKIQKPYDFICSGVREYLQTCAEGSFDVVVGMGLLHCFPDPLTILVEMARVASRAVMLEITHAGLNLSGTLPDPDGVDDAPSLANHVKNNHQNIRYMMELAPSALVNAAGVDASYQGMSCLMSRQAVETTMKSLGFKVTRISLEKHPTMNEHVLTYTGARNFSSLPSRYFLRCIRISSSRSNTCFNMNLPTLELAVTIDKRQGLHSWSSQPKWHSFQGVIKAQEESGNAEGCTLHKAAEEKALSSPKNERAGNSATKERAGSWSDSESASWVFDSEVALRFERVARNHIPDYEAIVDLSVSLVEQDAERLGNKLNYKVVDYGAAIGYTMIQLFRRGFTNVHGVDVAKAMLDRARELISQQLQPVGWKENQGDFISNRLHDASRNPLHLPELLIRSGSCDTGHDNFDYSNAMDMLDAVLLNWTLHFVPDAKDRKKFLRRIACAMKTGALLILSEKTQQSPETKKAYYDWKHSQGVSWDEIAEKEKKLKGVLEPLPMAWYFQILEECGFCDVSVMSARFSFITFVARRDHRKIAKDGDSDGDTDVWPSSTETTAFVSWPNLQENADKVHFSKGEFHMLAWNSKCCDRHFGEDGASVFGFVSEGETILRLGNGRQFNLYEGMYFACPGKILLEGGCGIVIVAPYHQCLFTMGGPVRAGDEGRLPYIDGCSDTLLISPVHCGDPCLNHLHFPGGIQQTQHTHPSGRAGVVIGGRGICVCKKADEDEVVRTALNPGVAFVIPKGVLHAFETAEGDELDVIAFHPDSDFGPTATSHPMVNRTFVGGKSASFLPDIQTEHIKARKAVG